MTDQEKTEKLIAALQKAIDAIERWVPMFEQHNTPAAIQETIELLKAQESVKPNAIMHGKLVMYYQCPSCVATIDPSDNFCRRCGRPVKWK